MTTSPIDVPPDDSMVSPSHSTSLIAGLPQVASTCRNSQRSIPELDLFDGGRRTCADWDSAGGISNIT
jgi:hypothetical protein